MHDDLARLVEEAISGEYEIVGDLGRVDAVRAYLAREFATGDFVVMQIADGDDELTVLPALSDAVPASGGVCPTCLATRASWSEPCIHCGRVVASDHEVEDRETMLARVRDAADGCYDVIGVIGRGNGLGPVYFARDPSSGRLLGLTIGSEDAAGGARLEVFWESSETTELAVAPIDREQFKPMASPSPRRSVHRSARWFAAAVLVLVPVLVGAVYVRCCSELVQPTTSLNTPPIAGAEQPVRDSVTGVLPAGPSTVTGTKPEPPPDSAAISPPRQPSKEPSSRLLLHAVPMTRWHLLINGRAVRSRTAIRLKAGRRATIRIEGDGFCAESLIIQTVQPDSTYQWTLPKLRSTSGVPDC